ncbi:LuxR family transcriptional regulator [Bradyrhizobium sp. LTSP857]|uniref:LuxR family transcriptional regulator n=1 Tax=Bradyrhizobium sp. LTSP857 TaxID=1619231 RepID=UPI000AC06BBD
MATLRAGMTEAAVALDLRCFAYLIVPKRAIDQPGLISSYPPSWTEHYLRNHYERLDPVIVKALGGPEPFEWGMDVEPTRLSKSQQQLFDEAAEFGIRRGYTVPIHDGRGPIAAFTFATDEPRIAAFCRRIEKHRYVLQLMAMYFHVHARRKVIPEYTINGAVLSPRELECLEWAARGKTAWETGRILGISRHTTATYLENAKTKLGVRTIVQAVARLTASKQIIL